jgi:hypothetical protein
MSYEKIFEYDLDITGATDFGSDMEAMSTGRESVPLQGAQFDVTLAGPVKGRVTGTTRGVDYLLVRPDGRRELELRYAIETDDVALKSRTVITRPDRLLRFARR